MDINYKNDGENYLMIAWINNNIETVKYLIKEEKININQKDNNDNNCLINQHYQEIQK